MKAFMNIGLAASLANLSLASLTTHNPLNGLKPKRALLTCLETYGGGSMTCGGIDSLFCYDPTVGETCCAMDNGYCKAGDFCAPVAGFCCTISEDPETCAMRLDFTLPPSFSLPLPTASSISTRSMASAPTAPTSEKEPATTRTSTSTIQITLASEVPIPALSTIPVAAAAPTLDTNGMTPQFTAPVGNEIAPEYTAPVNATDSVVATKTSSGNLVAFTGAAGRTEIGNGIVDAGSALGIVLVFVGLVL